MGLSRLCVMALVLAAACAPRRTPRPPGDGPSEEVAGSVRSAPVESAPRRSGRDVVIGEMCPKAAADRPAVRPMFVRRVSWSAAADEVARPIQTRSARQFSVLAWDGRRAGVFSVAGAATSDAGTAAIGAYAGASPCQLAGTTADQAAPVIDPTCVSVTEHCGIAVAVLEPSSGLEARPFDEDANPVPLDIGGACVVGGVLEVDIDRDGRAERFRLSDFVGGMRDPTDEVSAIAGGGKRGACEPAFAIGRAIPEGDPRDWRGLDVLGVVDFDGDGRRELVLAFRYQDRSTWAIYGASGTPARLELVGESIPWPR